MYNNNQLNSWTKFFKCNQIQFVTQFKDPPSGLFKLTQTTSVQRFANIIWNIFKSCCGSTTQFFTQLVHLQFKTTHKIEVQALQAKNLMQQWTLLGYRRKIFGKLRKYQRYPYHTTNYSNHKPPHLVHFPLFHHCFLNNHPMSQSNDRRLLPDRREKRLCYTCDEKFIHGHKCKSKLFLLVHEDDEIPYWTSHGSITIMFYSWVFPCGYH